MNDNNPTNGPWFQTLDAAARLMAQIVVNYDLPTLIEDNIDMPTDVIGRGHVVADIHLLRIAAHDILNTFTLDAVTDRDMTHD